jgi:uncharacterized protein (TIGR02058 family)
MALKRLIVEIGMGVDLTGADYTKAAVRALRDALWHNSLTIATAVGQTASDMFVEVIIGVPKPELVDKETVLAVLTYGKCKVEVVKGGLEVMNDAGTNLTVMANAAAVVFLDIPEK